MKTLLVLAADIEILARTIWGEARGETYKGKKAIGHVMLNRALSEFGQWKNDDTLSTACLRNQQFSCWNINDPNFIPMQQVTFNDPVLRECVRAGMEAIDEPDFTNGARHYHTKQITPYWIKRQDGTLYETCFGIGNHVFYNNIP